MKPMILEWVGERRVLPGLGEVSSGSLFTSPTELGQSYIDQGLAVELTGKDAESLRPPTDIIALGVFDRPPPDITDVRSLPPPAQVPKAETTGRRRGRRAGGKQISAEGTPPDSEE